MSEFPGTSETPQVAGQPDGRASTERRLLWAILIALGVLIVLVIVLLVVRAGDDDETEQPVASDASTTTLVEATTAVASTTTTVPATTTTAPAETSTTVATTTTVPATTSPPVDDTADGIWPWPTAGVVFTDPVAAATDFAVDFVGMTEPVSATFRPGASGTGEVDVNSVDSGRPTTVAVRQLGPAGHWYVVGATTTNIVIDAPEPFALVGSPLTLTGRARAFEGNVNVRLFADGSREPLVESFVTGSGDVDLGPFEGAIEFDAADASGGTLLLTTFSPADGSVAEFAAIRVFFGGR